MIRVLPDVLVIIALSVPSALFGYAFYGLFLRHGVYAEPLWLQGLVFVGFQMIVTLGVLRWIGDLPPSINNFPKYKALFDKAQRTALLKTLVIFLLSPIPHLTNSSFALQFPAEIAIESFGLKTIRGVEKCHYRGTVSAKSGEERRPLTSAEFPFSFVGSKRLCLELESSKGRIIRTNMTVYQGIMTFVEYDQTDVISSEE